MRIIDHPVLGSLPENPEYVNITIDGKPFRSLKGEVIAAALLANGIKLHRYTSKKHEERGIYCGIGQCTDCVMTVNGVPNVRTCITQVEEGMSIQTQTGFGVMRK